MLLLVSIVFYYMALKKAIFDPKVVRDLLRMLPDNLVMELLNARGEPLTFEEACTCSIDVLNWAVKETYSDRFKYVPLHLEDNEVYARWTGEKASGCIYIGKLSDRWFTSE